MPSNDLCPKDLQTLALATERALNEQLFANGTIPEDLYRAAKADLEQDGGRKRGPAT